MNYLFSPYKGTVGDDAKINEYKWLLEKIRRQDNVRNIQLKKTSQLPRDLSTLKMPLPSQVSILFEFLFVANISLLFFFLAESDVLLHDHQEAISVPT